MKKYFVFLSLCLLVSVKSYSQRFYLGNKLTPNSSKFKLLGISSTTQVATYRYTGVITDKYFFNRRVGDIIVGFKNGVVVSTIYNLIPEKGDVGTPKSFMDLVQKSSPFPLAYRNGFWGANIDNETIAIGRANNVLTFNKDRIMFMNSVRNSILSSR